MTTAANSINIDSGEQSALISSEDIQHLSVEGRDVTELLKILPGFAISKGGAGKLAKRAGRAHLCGVFWLLLCSQLGTRLSILSAVRKV